MESSLLTKIALPVALFLIMMGMGMSLVPSDFKRVFLYPKAVFVGLFIKVLLLPLFMFGILQLVPMRMEMAVGFMLLAACPGGAMSNLVSHLANANVALSITLTAFASFITVFTVPIVVNLSSGYFVQEAYTVQLDLWQTVAQISLLTILPVLLGMLVNHYAPKFAARIETPFKYSSAAAISIIITAALLKEHASLLEHAQTAGPMAFGLNILGIALGFGLPKLLGLSDRQAITIAVETGIINTIIGITVAATLIGDPVMTIPSAIYSLMMFPTVIFAIYFGLKKLGKAESN